MTERARYMDGDLTFHEYYGLLVEFLGEQMLRAYLPVQKTPDEWRELIEEDQHLNNVSLSKWDSFDPLVTQLVRRSDLDKLAEITGSKGWSLSDSVCVLKETARRYATNGREN